jgi:hypothetical protein
VRAPREFEAAVKLEDEPRERDTWPAPDPKQFAPCGCFFPAMPPPEGSTWEHAPGCEQADTTPPPGFERDGL